MSQVFEKHLELVTLSDPALGTQVPVGDAYTFSSAYVPKVGVTIARGVSTAAQLSAVLNAVKNTATPVGGFEVIFINNAAGAGTITISNAQTAPAPAALVTISIPLAGYGICIVPGEWMSTSTSFSASESGVFSIDIIYWA